jgi:23S rRNA pseudouridine1911/1915/1917 synthase
VNNPKDINTQTNHIEPPLTFSVATHDVGRRVDKVLAAHIKSLSRNQVQQLIKDEEILVNNAPVKASYKLENDDYITVYLPAPPNEQSVVPQDIELDILYADDHLAVINKPAGMVVHPGHGNEDGTLVNALLARWPNLPMPDDDPVRAGIVHRLDKDTSGVIIVALDAFSLVNLADQFQARTVEKHYLALVEKHPPNDRGRIDAPIGRDPQQRKRMAVVRDGRDAITDFSVREFYAREALLDVHPITGRTHQIRVHLAFIGCPIIGDRVYGYRKQRFKLKRVFLHAYKITFKHPYLDEHMTFEAPLPVGLQNILDKLPR